MAATGPCSRWRGATPTGTASPNDSARVGATATAVPSTARTPFVFTGSVYFPNLTRQMPIRELENKTALVTGGGSGIGRAIAVRFARAGARVAVLDVVEAAAADTLREIESVDGSGAVVRCD